MKEHLNSAEKKFCLSQVGDFTEFLLQLAGQAEQLKRELLSKIAETKTGCEATIESKAQQLTSALEAADRCPCATASSQWWALPSF